MESKLFIQYKLKLTTRICTSGFYLNFDLRFHVTLKIQRLCCIVTLVIQQFQPKWGEEQVFNLFLSLLYLYQACDHTVTFPNVSCSEQQQSTDAIGVSD